MSELPRIRPVTHVDLPAVRTQLVDTWHATYDAIYGRADVVAITNRWHSLETLARQLEQPNSAFLLAERGGNVVASSYAVLTADTAHLYRLYVHASVQRTGLGASLMAATFKALPAARIERLEVEPANAAALGFYRREGFQEIGRTTDCGGSSGKPALIFERTASPSRG